MNYKILVVCLAVFLMVLSPTAGGIIYEGQASQKREEVPFDKEELEEITVELYITSTGEKVCMDIEEYVVGVMMAEVPYNYDAEALKAMAVAIRSYALRRVSRNEKSPVHLAAHLCDDYSHCMGYISFADAEKRWGKERTDVYYKTLEDAVNETEGEILRYGDCIADTVFHASSGGFTESAQNVWGVEVPYLVSVPTPDKLPVSRRIFSSAEFCELLLDSVGTIELSGDASEWIEKIEKDDKGRVSRIFIGGKVISGRRLREIFDIDSTCFEVTCEDGNIIFDTVGKGHGVGMSMAGADAFAKSGKDYRKILEHYYPETELTLFRENT
ncbi:MAG: stage II sporulation protein D [Ruminococcaceae bacterium]|nr:stage II sporulation protein D [Oscillospiraceae bacterium]